MIFLYKEKIVVLENLKEIEITENTAGYNITYESNKDLGTYSNKDKALAVLELIERNYNNRTETYQLPLNYDESLENFMNYLSKCK